MPKSRWFALAVLTCIGRLCGFQADPATADCVKMDVWVTWASGAPPTYVTPWAAGTCVVPTPFTAFSNPDAGYDDPSASPPLPRSVHARGSVPAP